MRRHATPLTAGLLVALSMPPWGWWPLAIVGLALYARAARARRDDSPFITAGVFALGWFVPALAWMWWLTAPGYLVTCALFAGLHGGAAWAAARTAPPSPSRHALALVAWHGLAETFRLAWPFGGVPLATLGISQAGSPLARLAPLGGVVLIAAAAMWIGFSPRRRVPLASVALACLVAPFLDGTSRGSTTVAITAVQGGGEQGTHAVDTDPREAFERHLALTRTLPPGGRDMVVWPENVVNISGEGLFADSPEHDDLVAEARRLGVPLVVGVTEDAGDAFTNAQIVIAPDGTVADRYDKVRRVPFGEYVPMRGLLASIGAPVDMVPRDAVAGRGRARLDVTTDVGTIRLAVAISWEVFFGGRVNEGVTDGAALVLNPTNGSSYTGTILQSQQVASSRLRAREQGRWLVQVSPTGFSAFVSPSGEVFDRTAVGEAAVIDRTMPLATGRTPYSRTGDAPAVVGLALLALVIRRRPARKFSTDPK